MQAAKVLDLEQARERKLMPEAHGRVVGNGRAIAAAKFHELGDKIASGELDGARIQWRDDDGPVTEMVTVTVNSTTVQMLTTKIEEG